ncbi:MAG: aminotransferase class I/II-fold pyridoxal phosphate-dependent enzyme [Bdellovibrionota bacterium]
MIAERMKSLEASGVRKMFELAASMKNPIDFSLGQPHFDVPQRVKDVAIKSILEGRNRYTVTGGVPEFREAIRASLSEEGVHSEDMIAVAGGSGGLVLALLSLVDPGTDVFVPDPYFATYGHMISLAGGVPRWIDTYPDFRFTAERLESAVNATASSSVRGHPKKGRPGVLLFNSPVNPTGVAYTAAEISTLAQAARRIGLQVISDEVYDHFSYDHPHECWLKHDPGAVLVRTFGKTWGMTGWRSGFAAGPKAVIEAMSILQQFTFVCVNTPAQWASIEALKTDVSELIEGYRKKRDMVYEGLKQAYSLHKPEGAFYVYPKVPVTNPIGNNKDVSAADEFMRRCIENEILVVPGKTFSQKNTHFRISFAVNDETLKRGIDRLVKIARQMA